MESQHVLILIVLPKVFIQFKVARVFLGQNMPAFHIFLPLKQPADGKKVTLQYVDSLPTTKVFVGVRGFT